MDKNKEIAVLGAGLVGSLLSLYLAKENFKVNVYEKRQDPRKNRIDGGRSINLALSHRGLHALDRVGLKDKALEFGLPMKGRMIHDVEGNLTFQPYGKEGQAIYSISRTGLNKMLIEESEKAGTYFNFGKSCKSISLDTTQLQFEDSATIKPDRCIGADGAFSVLRSEMQKTDRFNYAQEFLEHGYKELTIPESNGDFAMDPEALHIWPRGGFMLIALPNPDKTFTATLFFSFEGEESFKSLETKGEIIDFFERHFKDVIPLMPDLIQEFEDNPTSSLVSISCYPWVINRSIILGDAAHAIVPFYGQGMNSGFEDCRIFFEILEKYNFNWDISFNKFQESRKKDADAIRDLALANFIEMRDKVGDPQFLFRKKIEAELTRKYSEKWLSQYSMVTFSDINYSTALQDGNLKTEIVSNFVKYSEALDKQDFDSIMNEYHSKTYMGHS
ncbi:MAG: NAD(P)/FAD-dependent oxidoreductase [Bacteroidota bacterium]